MFIQQSLRMLLACALALCADASFANGEDAFREARDFDAKATGFDLPERERKDFALKAIKRYSDVISKTKDINQKAEAFYRRGDLHLLLDETKSAIIDFSASLALVSQQPVVLHRRSMAAQGERNIKMALNDLSEAIRMDSNLPHVYLDRGIILFELGRLREARSDLTRHLTLDPDSSLGYSLRGSISFMEKDYEAAISDFLHAVDIQEEQFPRLVNNKDGYNPSQTDLYMKIGESYARAGNTRKQIDMYRRGIINNPGSVDLRNAAAWILVTSTDDGVHNPQEGLRLALEAQKLSGGRDANVLDTLAEAYCARGQTEKAIEAQQRAVHLRPNDSGFRERLWSFKRGKAHCGNKNST